MPSAGSASADAWIAAARACSSAWCLLELALHALLDLERVVHAHRHHRSVSAMKSSAKWSFWIFGNFS
jgi:hypothetical protein